MSYLCGLVSRSFSRPCPPSHTACSNHCPFLALSKSTFLLSHGLCMSSLLFWNVPPQFLTWLAASHLSVHFSVTSSEKLPLITPLARPSPQLSSSTPAYLFYLKHFSQPTLFAVICQVYSAIIWAASTRMDSSVRKLEPVMWPDSSVPS